MAGGVDDSFLVGPIFSDADLEALFSSRALARAMTTVEAALSRAQGRLGMIPSDAAAAIDAAAEAMTPPEAALATGVAASAVPVQALVARLKAAVGAPHASWVHWGATSQDIVDTAMVLQHLSALGQLSQRLASLVDALEAHSRRSVGLVMAARTRGQIATPISLGLRIAQRAQLLVALEAETAALTAGLGVVQFGGGHGSRSAVAPNGAAWMKALASELVLAPAPPWHVDRSVFRRYSQWLARLVAPLAKLGGDLALLGRSEAREASAGLAGGSSTMPHKANPISADALRALHAVSIACEAGLASVASHLEERDGGAWSAEWLLLPRHAVTGGAPLRHAERLVATLQPDAARMVETLEQTPTAFAESAAFALARTIGRDAALALVAAALANPKVGFKQALIDAGGRPDLVEAAFDPARDVAASAEVIDAIFDRRAKTL